MGLDSLINSVETIDVRIVDSTFVKNLRQDLKLSQRQFGDLFGVSGSSVARWESEGVLQMETKIKIMLVRLRQKYDADKAQTRKDLKVLLILGGLVAFLFYLFKDVDSA